MTRNTFLRVANHKATLTLLGFFRSTMTLMASVSVIIGVYAFYDDLERSREARLISAWGLLTAPGSGNTGKIGALEVIARSGQPLIDIDLSCRMEKDAQGSDRCNRGVYLGGVRLPGVDLGGARLDGATLTAADLRTARLDGTSLNWVDLAGAQLDGASLKGASLFRSSLQDASLSGADLTGVAIIDVNLSGVDFSNVTGLDHSDTRLKGWAWDDQLPTGLPAASVTPCSRTQTPSRDFMDRFAAPSACR